MIAKQNEIIAEETKRQNERQASQYEAQQAYNRGNDKRLDSLESKLQTFMSSNNHQNNSGDKLVLLLTKYFVININILMILLILFVVSLGTLADSNMLSTRGCNGIQAATSTNKKLTGILIATLLGKQEKENVMLKLENENKELYAAIKEGYV